jgi:hypothetical protein
MWKKILAVVLLLAGCSGSKPKDAHPEGGDGKGDALQEKPTDQTPGGNQLADAKRGASEEPDGDTRGRGDGEGEPAPRQRPAPVSIPAPQGQPPAWLNGTGGAYRAGDAVQYLPKDCKERVFIDLGGIVGGDGDQLKSFVDQLVGLGSAREAARVKKVIEIVRKSGADPIGSWREIAICKTDDGERAVIGMTAAKPVEIAPMAQEIKVALEEDPGTVVRKGDLSTLVSHDGDSTFQPGPWVVLVGRDHAAIESDIAKKAGAAGFAKAKGHLVWAESRDADIAIKDRAGTFDIRVVIHLRGDAAEGAKTKSKEIVQKIREEIDGVAAKLMGTPLEPLAARMKAVKITVEGSNIVFKAELGRSEALGVIKNASAADLAKLMKSF